MQRAKELGDFVRTCYGKPLAATSSATASSEPLVLNLPSSAVATSFDRVVLQEDLAQGQRVRAYTVEHRASAEQPWVPFSTGTSIGNKRIDLAAASVQVEPRKTRCSCRLRVD